MLCGYNSSRLHVDNAVYIRNGGRDEAGAVFWRLCGEVGWSCCETDCGKGLFERLKRPLFGGLVPEVAKWRAGLPRQYIGQADRLLCRLCMLCSVTEPELCPSVCGAQFQFVLRLGRRVWHGRWGRGWRVWVGTEQVRTED
jgi:hypothetical protein